jgi:MFS family permease
VLTSIALALSFPAWGRLIDRFGNKSIMILSMILLQTQNYLWCLLTPGNSWMLYPMWVWGGWANGGFLLGLFNLLLKLAPLEAKTLAIGMNLAATSLVMALAAIVGGHLLVMGRQAGYSGLNLYHLAFLFQPTLAMLSCLILLNIQEPRATRLVPMLQSMFALSNTGYSIGLSAFARVFRTRR